ncbi:MAG: hypothetical protein ACREL7_07305 [Longimicrobiales bacterium]
MSNDGDRSNPTSLPDWDRIEWAVRRAFDDRDVWYRRAQLAETRVRELEAALRDVSSGTLDPMQLSEHARDLERENRMLIDRLGKAREAVDRIMTRLNFAEEER